MLLKRAPKVGEASDLRVVVDDTTPTGPSMITSYGALQTDRMHANTKSVLLDHDPLADRRHLTDAMRPRTVISADQVVQSS